MKRFFRFENDSECFCVDFGNPDKSGDFAVLQKYKIVKGRVIAGEVYDLGLSQFWDNYKIKAFLMKMTE